MSKIHPVHYQTHPLAALCGASPLDPGIGILIGTDNPEGITCAKCVMAMPLAGVSPITEEEHGALIRRARTSLRDMIEPLDEWLEHQRLAAERRHAHRRAIEELIEETPWWDLLTRFTLARALGRGQA